MDYGVSLIVTSYNQLIYLEAHIDALFDLVERGNQLIIVDDGSDDGSKEFLQSERFDAICVRHTNRKGVSAAINEGLRFVREEYVALLGADDKLEPDAFGVAEIELMRSGSDIVFCVPKIIGSDGLLLRDEIFPVFSSVDIRRFNANPLKYLYESGNALCASTAFGHRSAFQDVGFFNEALLQLQDYEYWIRAALGGKRLLISDMRWGMYRYHSAGLSRSVNLARSNREWSVILRSIGDEAWKMESIVRILKEYIPDDLRASLNYDVAWAWIQLQHPQAIVREEGILQAYKCLSRNPSVFEGLGATRWDIWQLANV